MTPTATLPGGSALRPRDAEVDLEALARAAAGGDVDAFGVLYDALAPSTLRFLRKLGRLAPEQLDDALQESFLRLLRRLPALDRPARVRSYLFGIAHHVAVDAARARRPVEVDDEPASSAPDPARATEGHERDALVAAALAALPDGLRAALAMRHVGGLSMEELASALECSVPTARARLREAASRLAVELRRRGLDPATEVRS